MRTRYRVIVKYLLFDFDDLMTAVNFAELAMSHYSKENMERLGKTDVTIHVYREEADDE